MVWLPGLSTEASRRHWAGEIQQRNSCGEACAYGQDLQRGFSGAPAGLQRGFSGCAWIRVVVGLQRVLLASARVAGDAHNWITSSSD